MILLNRRHSERKYFNLLHSVHQTFLHPLQNFLHLWFAQFQTQLIITSTLWTWSTDWKKSICMLKIASWSSIPKTQSGRLVQKDQFLTSEYSIRAHTGEKKSFQCKDKKFLWLNCGHKHVREEEKLLLEAQQERSNWNWIRQTCPGYGQNDFLHTGGGTSTFRSDAEIRSSEDRRRNWDCVNL